MVSKPTLSRESDINQQGPSLADIQNAEARFANYQVSKDTLVITRKGLKDDDIAELCIYLNNHPEISTLDLSYNDIKDDGAIGLSR